MTPSTAGVRAPVAYQTVRLDRRRQALWVTEQGDRVLRSVRTRRTAWLAVRLNRLPPEKLDAVLDAIEPLEGLLEEEERL